MSNQIGGVLAQGDVRTVFQPIVDGATGAVYGFEALSRGPTGSALESPAALFGAAVRENRLVALERACIVAALRSFAALGSDRRLFMNVHPQTIFGCQDFPRWLGTQIHESRVDPHLLVIEMTEHGNPAQESVLAGAVRPLRELGCEIAVDDLGAGSSGLKSWSAMRPEFVKVDRYFVGGAEHDPVRAEILRSVVDIGRATGSQIVAEGIENPEQLAMVLELGVDYVQGYLLGRPQARPSSDHHSLATFQRTVPGLQVDCAEQLASSTPAVPAATPVAAVVELFQRNPGWRAVAVVEGSRPVGLIRRDELLILLSRPLYPEVYNRKPVAAVMDPAAVQIDSRARLDQVSRMVTGRVAARELDDFIITRGGEYLGLGRTIDLLRHITTQQIQAARHANPLTGLPGNREIKSQIQRWVTHGRAFVACHLDLDHFKPFNDTYGYSEGDQVLLHVADVLSRWGRPRVDFVGHVGGDDFVILLRSQDWSLRLSSLLEELAASLPNFHSEAHRTAAGYAAVDREGAEKTFPLLSVSIAALEVSGGAGLTVDAVMEGLLKTKAAAKARPGNVCLLATPSGVFDLAAAPTRPSFTPVVEPEDEHVLLKAVGYYPHS